MPYLQQENAKKVKILCLSFKKKVKFQNINYRVASLYIALHMTEDEQRRSPLYRVLRRRTTRNGVRPGVSAKPGNAENWVFPAEPGQSSRRG